MRSSIRVFAPATVANVGPGFDVFGFAVESPGDIIEASKNEVGKVRLLEITGDGGRLPRDTEHNVVGHVAQKLISTIQSDRGVDLRLKKGIPLSSGLGGSAASAVASVYAINILFDKPLSKKELLPLALEGERLASGAPHADNVTPCLYGGFTIIRSYKPLDIVQVTVPEELICVAVSPDYHIRTEDARKVLPTQLTLTKAIRQWGNTAALVAGLFKGDFDLIGRAIEDLVAEPVRSSFIPAFSEVKKAAMDAGALGCSISGSGPTVFALTNDLSRTRMIGHHMQKAFTSKDLKSRLFISKINTEGPRIL